MKKHFTKLLFTFLTIVLIGQAGISQTYIWGGPGDKNSEFDGGLNDWTVTATPDSALWVWEADGAADRGAYYGTRGPIQSPSVSNGAAVFDSDFYDNAGIPGNFGNGIAPTPQTGELISPEFSCEGHTSVWIQFNQYFRNYQSTTTYAVSIDGGETWIDGHPFNTDIAVNAATDDSSVKLINISDIAANQPNVKIKFIFNANYYFWIIDDVYIIDSPPADPQIAGTWYPPNRFNTPQSQIANDSMYFIMDVINRGGADVAEMGAKVRILNLSTDVNYFEDSTTVALAAGDTIQISFTSFMPTSEMDTGLYAAVYDIFAADAASQDGKRHIQYFRVNGDTPIGGEDGFWTYSNMYTVSDANATGGVSFQGSGAAGPVNDVYNINYYKMADWVENDNVYFRATEANLAISMSGSGPISYPVNVFMFEVADTVDNQLFNWNFIDGIIVDGNESTQLTYVGYAAENIENVNNYDLVTVPLTSSDDEDDYVELHPNKKYFLAALWPKGTRYYAAYDNSFQGYSRFYFDQRLSLVYLDDGSGARFYTLGGDYGAWQQGLILKFGKAFDATDDELLPDNTVTIIQNPADTELGVNINFDNTIEKATMVVHNINGDVIDMKTVKNIQKGSYKFYTGKIPAGTYIFTLFTKDKLTSKKFVVQH